MANKSNEDTTDSGRTEHFGKASDFILSDAAGEFESLHVLRIQTQWDLTTTNRGQLFPQGNALGT